MSCARARVVAVKIHTEFFAAALSGTREEPGTLTQGAPVFPGSSRVCVDSECLIGKQKKPILKGHRLGAEFHTVQNSSRVRQKGGSPGPHL